MLTPVFLMSGHPIIRVGDVDVESHLLNPGRFRLANRVP